MTHWNNATDSTIKKRHLKEDSYIVWVIGPDRHLGCSKLAWIPCR